MEYRVPEGHQLLPIAGETCRACDAPPTYLLVKPIDPDKWLTTREMSLIAVPWCDACSPAAMWDEASEVRPQPTRRDLTWLERLMARWLFAHE